MAHADKRMIFLASVDSTNSYLRTLALRGAEAGTAVSALSQSAGRGRMGRVFHSPAGAGVYMSYLLRPGDSGDIAAVTAWAAAAVSRAIEKSCGIKPGIKWVNDLIFDGKKVCGILTESVIEGGRASHIICGVGVNVNETEFPAELREKAVSLAMILGHPVNREALLYSIVEELDTLAADWPDKKAEYLRRYRESCVTVGREVMLLRDGTETRGFAVGIGDDFSLLVRLADGKILSVSSGEVSVRGIYGYV